MGEKIVIMTRCRMHVIATDLHASASRVLVAGGQIEVHRVHHLYRGHEQLESKLRAETARSGD